MLLVQGVEHASASGHNDEQSGETHSVPGVICRNYFATPNIYTNATISFPSFSVMPSHSYTLFIQSRTCRYACRGMTSGLRFDRAKASAASWEMVSVRIMLPMDIKNLLVSADVQKLAEKQHYPKVAPDPIIYCPSVRPIPFGPAPYLIMLTEPSKN